MVPRALRAARCAPHLSLRRGVGTTNHRHAGGGGATPYNSVTAIRDLLRGVRRREPEPEPEPEPLAPAGDRYAGCARAAGGGPCAAADSRNPSRCLPTPMRMRTAAPCSGTAAAAAAPQTPRRVPELRALGEPVSEGRLAELRRVLAADSGRGGLKAPMRSREVPHQIAVGGTGLVLAVRERCPTPTLGADAVACVLCGTHRAAVCAAPINPPASPSWLCAAHKCERNTTPRLTAGQGTHKACSVRVPMCVAPRHRLPRQRAVASAPGCGPLLARSSHTSRPGGGGWGGGGIASHRTVSLLARALTALHRLYIGSQWVQTPRHGDPIRRAP
jgi:hypothetical protein